MLPITGFFSNICLLITGTEYSEIEAMAWEVCYLTSKVTCRCSLQNVTCRCPFQKVPGPGSLQMGNIRKDSDERVKGMIL